MNKNRYSFFHAVVQKIASSRPGAWFYARTLHHVDRVAFKLSGGRATMTGTLAGLPVVILTTTGAKSGLPRTLPLLCIRDERNPATFGLLQVWIEFSTQLSLSAGRLFVLPVYERHN
jgi:F420H(2)-dependent quinone reductase